MQSCGVTALAHLTCVSASREQISVVVDRMKKANINNILALRGDIPEGMDLSRSEHYRYASDLVADVKKLGDFCVGGACYPEGHVDSPNKALDIDHLKAKVDTGLRFLVSQMFFDNNNFYRFLYRTLDKGINVPILAGIMPVTIKRRFSALSSSAARNCRPGLFRFWIGLATNRTPCARPASRMPPTRSST